MSPAAARSVSASSTPEPSSYQRLREHLAYLQMTAAAEHLAVELDRALKEKLSATQVLEQLLAIEVAATRERRQRGRLRFARYPVHKTLAEFDLDFQPGIDRKVVAELSTLRFVEERRNVILLGPPGVGKSHLAIALGIAATDAGYRTYFTAASDMVAALQAAHLEGTAAYKLRTCRAGPGARRLPRRIHRALHQDLGLPARPRRRPSRRQLGASAASLPAERRAHPRRLRDARVHSLPGRGPL